jgi:hypothetical protein
MCRTWFLEMSDPASENTRFEVHSDEDWKERVKSEDRLRDEQLAAEGSAPASDASATPDPFGKLPRVDFSVLVQIFITQAMAALGLIGEPGKEPPPRHLPLARHFIDLLAVLEEKTRGNLTAAEEKLLSTSLHELRLMYVELGKQSSGLPDTPSA